MKMQFLKNNNLMLAWIVSVLATGGSLYFSEVKGFIPCDWCWYQRILMYPLVIILGISAFQKDRNIVKYVLPMSVLGVLIALVHYGEQKIGFISKLFGNVCSSGIPCGGMYINYAGFITIPFLSLVAFTLIFVLLSLNKKS